MSLLILANSSAQKMATGELTRGLSLIPRSLKRFDFLQMKMKAKKQAKSEETKLSFQQSPKWIKSEREAIQDYLNGHIPDDDVKAAACYEFAPIPGKSRACFSRYWLAKRC
jgi:hypothetical protein